MSFSETSRLGIISCPGAEFFAHNVTKHLAGIYKRRFERKVANLSARYKIAPDEVMRQINLHEDVDSRYVSIPGNIDHYRSPQLKVSVRHTYFANGEIKAEILDSVRGRDLYIFQDVSNLQPIALNDGSQHQRFSINDHLFSLYVTVDAAMQAGAECVNLVLPTYPYSRQHKRKGRECLTAARIGQILESLGAARIITLDIHSKEIENSFRNLHLESLHASLQIIEKLIGIIDISNEEIVVLAPDTGAIDRNKFYANALQKPLAMLYKERDYSKVTRSALESNISEIKLLGDIRGKTVFMADDILGTGSTLINAMRTIRDQGSRRIICAVSLPFFSGSALEDFDKAYSQGLFYRIIGTNAVFHRELLQREWYIQVDVTKLFAQIINLVHSSRSVSSMLDNRELVANRIKKQLDKMARLRNQGVEQRPEPNVSQVSHSTWMHENNTSS